MANNWGTSLFVSIHANSASATSGTECYTHPNANSTTKNLSANVSRAVSNKFGIPNRGHKEEAWPVLMSSNMPAILVETAFITNASDASLLTNRQDDFANAIATQILNSLNINSTTNDTLNKIINSSFTKLLGSSFEKTHQELVIAQLGPIRVKLTSKSNAKVDGEIVAEFKDGKFVGGRLLKDLSDLSNALLKKVFSISKQLGKLGNTSFSISISENINTTTVSLTEKLTINNTSYSQILSFEFDKNSLKNSYETVIQSAKNIIKDNEYILSALLLIAAIVLFAFSGYVPIIVNGATSLLTGIGAVLYRLVLWLINLV